MKACDICGKKAEECSPTYYTHYPDVIHFDLCRPCEIRVTEAVMLAIVGCGISVEEIPIRVRPEEVPA